jgi:hypothetical protein
MVRSFAVAVAFLCVVPFAWAQTSPGTAVAAPAGGPATKAAAKKAGTIAKPRGPTENGPCQFGVIPAIGDQFVVQKVGLTIFNNGYTEVPIEAWGLDDLVVARVRAAAAPGAGVRRIAYPKAAFAHYDHPAPALFHSSNDDLTAIVRQIAANAGCERYVAVTKFTGTIEGTNQTHRGVGVFNRGTSLLSYTSLFADIQVTVFDGKTFAIHRNPISLGSVLAGTLSRVVQAPPGKLDNAAFPEPASVAAASATLREGARALLTANLDKTLPAILKEE